MSPMVEKVEAAFARLREARSIAASLQHDDTLHRLAMKAVFLLEDCYETLVRVSNEIAKLM